MTDIADMHEIDELARDVDALGRNVKDGAPRAVGKVGRVVYERARAAAPVDTGELVGGIYLHVEDGGETVRVGSPHKQGFFQEFGTSVMPAQPWLYPSAADAPKSLADLLSKLGAGLRGTR